MDTPENELTFEQSASLLRVPTVTTAAFLGLAIYSCASNPPRPGILLLAFAGLFPTAVATLTQVLKESDDRNVPVTQVLSKMGQVTLRDMKRCWDVLETPGSRGPSS